MLNDTEREILIQEAIAKFKSEFKILDSANIESKSTKDIDYSGFTATIEGQFHLTFWCGFNDWHDKYLIDLYFADPDIGWIGVKATTLDGVILKLTESIDRFKPWGSDRHAND